MSDIGKMMTERMIRNLQDPLNMKGQIARITDPFSPEARNYQRGILAQADGLLADVNRSVAHRRRMLAISLVTPEDYHYPDLEAAKKAYGSKVMDAQHLAVAFRDWLWFCYKPEDAEAAFKAARDDDARDAGFARWLRLCKKTEEAKRALKVTQNQERKDMAFKRWLELCQTPGEAREAFRFTSNHVREEWARERIRELTDK